MSQTCIKRYRNSDSNFVVMHPMPDWFDRVLASMDPVSIAERNIGKRNAPAQDYIDYDYDSNFENLIFREPIESFHYQKQANGLVFKLVHYPKDTILYTVAFLFFSYPIVNFSEIPTLFVFACRVYSKTRTKRTGVRITPEALAKIRPNPRSAQAPQPTFQRSNARNATLFQEGLIGHRIGTFHWPIDPITG